jgi:hypothetical protein
MSANSEIVLGSVHDSPAAPQRGAQKDHLLAASNLLGMPEKTVSLANARNLPA